MDLGNGVELNFTKLSDEQLQAARTELDAAGEARGLWVPEGAGQIAVVEAVETTEAVRAQILANAEADIAHTNSVFEIINAGRRKSKRFDIVSAGQQRERLEDQLTDEAIAATGWLHTSAERPLMVVPALPDAISAEELVDAVDKSSKRGIYSWAGRLPFLAKFPIDSLTGYDAERAESGAMTLIETGYDASRQGTRDQQLRALRIVQDTAPAVGTAPILNTASLGQRYNGQPNSWQDTYTRAIEVEPHRLDGFDYVVRADVGGDGGSDVLVSYVCRGSVSRRQVGLTA
jgi:hypothetical protein